MSKYKINKSICFYGISYKVKQRFFVFWFIPTPIFVTVKECNSISQAEMFINILTDPPDDISRLINNIL